ncbi:34-kDa subunit of RNA polymerase III (C) [Ciborinia camelliae]|nr:34-kDa subunit of RNA polymerase III (C) [Ciborinia camelliae]
MSSRAAPGAAAAPEDKTAALKKLLYDDCFLSFDENPTFFQEDLLELGILPNDDVTILLAVTQGLTNDKLFKVVQDAQRGIGWKLRTQEEAKQYRSLSSEQEIVYALIDEAGDEGIWTKTIKAKSNLHEAVFRSAIKHLETKHMISEMKSVEHSTRKMYIKSSLQPSDRATGGAWYTDNELDEEFITQLMHVLFDQIHRKSFYKSSSARMRKPKKVIGKNMSADEAKALRDKALGSRVKIEDVTEDDAMEGARRHYEALLPMPPGYQGYPTLNELTSFIENSGATATTLTAQDIQQLLEILIFDNKIEKVLAGPEGVCYRAVRKSFREDHEGGPFSALTDVPCGHCPVADLCEEGGPVGPSTCEYFQTWLNI